MSSGYTSDKANIAPAEPAAAWPIGGKVSLVMAAIIKKMRNVTKRKKKKKKAKRKSLIKRKC